VSGDASLFKIVPGRDEVVNYRSVPQDAGSRARLAELHLRLLGAGVIVGAKGTGCLSTPMDRDEINTFVDALERVVREIAR
jgi:glutamate-1-semialdehyde aminotransferase